jgi:hypothetical protein
MFQDSWTHYEARHPKRWIFHPRKRSIVAPLLTIGTAILIVFAAISRF